MRTATVLTIVIAVFALGSMALASAEFGPPTPVAQQGQFAVGVGYNYSASEWENEDADTVDEYCAKQNQMFVQGTYGVVNGLEVYGRLGMADATIEAPLERDIGDPTDFEGDYELYYGVGVRGHFKSHLPVIVGAVFQYNRLSTYEATDFIMPGLDVSYEDGYDVSVGLSLEHVLSIGSIYGGGVAHWAKGSATAIIPDAGTITANYQEKGNVGGFLGLRLPLGSGLIANFEGQYKSDFSVSVSLGKVIVGM
jgi:hypothetical protein